MNGLAEPNDGQSGSGNIYLTPPELFAIVTEGIYRCASIEFPNVTFLKTSVFSALPLSSPVRDSNHLIRSHRLHLRTIVTLTPDPPPKPLQSLLTTPHPAISTSSSSASSAITTTELVHTPPLHASPEAWTTHRAQTLRALKAALHLLRKERQPVLVVDPGGLLCGIVRRWMGWNLTSVVLE
ncbi:MAG: hypothetical protein M1827_005444 [Pycnora praestabilis]|nr:MAG: hypothetical protein M1827_005444 [Pycnora praestabilis]